MNVVAVICAGGKMEEEEEIHTSNYLWCITPFSVN